jgi:hypothetical protein
MQVRRQNAWPPTTTNYAQNSGGLAARLGAFWLVRYRPDVRVMI